MREQILCSDIFYKARDLASVFEFDGVLNFLLIGGWVKMRQYVVYFSRNRDRGYISGEKKY